MNHGLVKVSDILGGIKFRPKPIQPPEIKAPIPKPPRVVGDPTRTPVNRQAAMLLSKPSWLTEPLPPELPKQSELLRLREENAKRKAANANLVADNTALRKRVEKLTILVNRIKPIRKPQAEAKPEPAQTLSDKHQLLERLT